MIFDTVRLGSYSLRAPPYGAPHAFAQFRLGVQLSPRQRKSPILWAIGYPHLGGIFERDDDVGFGGNPALGELQLRGELRLFLLERLALVGRLRQKLLAGRFAALLYLRDSLSMRALERHPLRSV
jgi:hypothetical protein